MINESMRVALVGCGGLGTSIAWGLLRHEDRQLELRLCDRHASKTAGVVKEFPRLYIFSSVQPQEAAENADVIIIVVKPKDVIRVLAQVRDTCGPDTLIISCAAGIRVDTMALALGKKVAIARAIPNTAVSVSAGTTGIYLGPQCDHGRDNARVERIFGALGEVRILESEEALHGVTALSSSGPAFVFAMLESMVDAGVRGGLARSEADFFARGAIRAAAALIESGVLSPADLRAQITSPAGTTVEGLYELERAGFRFAVMNAVDAAWRRSKELVSIQST